MRRWMPLVVAVASCCGEAERLDGDGAADGPSDVTEDVEAEGAPACTDAQHAAAEGELRALASGASPCFAGSIVVDAAHGVVVTFDAYFGSFDWGLSTCIVHPHSTPYEPFRMERAVRDAVGSWATPCPYVWAWVGGGAQDDAVRMGTEIERTCGMIWDAYFVIEIDADGRASDVYGNAGAAELVACIRTALADDLFPCLATTQLCPDYWISE